MQRKQIIRSVIVVAVVVVVLFIAHSLNLGPALVKALIAMHGGQ